MLQRQKTYIPNFVLFINFSFRMRLLWPLGVSMNIKRECLLSYLWPRLIFVLNLTIALGKLLLSFYILFSNVWTFWLIFLSMFFRLNLKGKAEVSAKGFCLDNECWRLYENKVHSLLQEGLGDRVKFVRVTWRNTTSASNISDVCDFMHLSIMILPSYMKLLTALSFLGSVSVW